MWKRKIALGTCGGTELTDEEQIRLFADNGFDGFFTAWRGLDVHRLARAGREAGIEYQSVHAPFNKTDDLWHGDDELAENGLKELIDCVHDCADVVPVIVSHCIIGFDNHSPNEKGLERFGILVRECEKYGLKIAFENTEGEEYLTVVMDCFASSPAVGFCWDSGHEMCYNHSLDMLAKYGDRLFATHLNDNLGISDFGGGITYLDDLHLLPFDGVADWKYNMDRLNACGYDGFLTFELKYAPHPQRFANLCYSEMTFEKYVTECYKRACKVAYLK